MGESLLRGRKHPGEPREVRFVEPYIEKVCELDGDCEFAAESKDQLIRDRLVLGLSSATL